MTDTQTSTDTAPPASDSTSDLPIAPGPVDENRSAATAADQNGPDAELVACPTCGNMRRKFLIVDGKCDSCRSLGQPAAIVPTLGWPEVRARRDRIIAATDWTQLGDVDPAVQQKFAPLRKRLRDVTTKPDAFAAWYELDAIEADAAK